MKRMTSQVDSREWWEGSAERGGFNVSPETLSADRESSLKFGGQFQILKNNESVSQEQLHSCDASLRVSKYFQS